MKEELHLIVTFRKDTLCLEQYFVSHFLRIHLLFIFQLSGFGLRFPKYSSAKRGITTTCSGSQRTRHILSVPHGRANRSMNLHDGVFTSED